MCVCACYVYCVTVAVQVCVCILCERFSLNFVLCACQEITKFHEKCYICDEGLGDAPKVGGGGGGNDGGGGDRGVVNLVQANSAYSGRSRQSDNSHFH